VTHQQPADASDTRAELMQRFFTQLLHQQSATPVLWLRSLLWVPFSVFTLSSWVSGTASDLSSKVLISTGFSLKMAA